MSGTRVCIVVCILTTFSRSGLPGNVLPNRFPTATHSRSFPLIFPRRSPRFPSEQCRPSALAMIHSRGCFPRDFSFLSSHIRRWVVFCGRCAVEKSKTRVHNSIFLLVCLGDKKNVVVGYKNVVIVIYCVLCEQCLLTLTGVHTYVRAIC